MVRVICIGAAIVLTATSASAQTPPAPQPTTIPVAIQRAYATIKTNLTQAADKMPEADYGFKPSTMPEMRVYGALFSHIAQSQFGACSAANGVANPMQGRQLETELTTKAQITAALAESFALCDTAYGSLTDANINEMIQQGRGPIARAALLANNVTHDNEMAGTAYVYLRARNIVPPSTENAAAARGGGGGGGRGGRGGGAPPGQ